MIEDNNILDKFFNYTNNFDISQFIYQFYEIEKPQYHEITKSFKILLLDLGKN